MRYHLVNRGPKTGTVKLDQKVIASILKASMARSNQVPSMKTGELMLDIMARFVIEIDKGNSLVDASPARHEFLKDLGLTE